MQAEVGMVARKDVAGDEGGLDILLPESAGVEIHASARFQQSLQSPQHGRIIGKVFHHAENDDRVVGLGRAVHQEILVQHLGREAGSR